ncbi:MAG: ComEA family DNA-binding protein [bacterium]
MQRGELALGAVLLAILLAGIAYENYRGADKTAELVITHSNQTPFDAGSTASSPTTSSPSRPIASTVPPAADTSGALVRFLNQTSLEQLLEAPGIGPVLARRILDKRAALGSFTDIQQINEVSGIGQAKMNDLLDYAESLSRKTIPMIRPTASAPGTSPPRLPLRLSKASGASPRKIPLNQATREDLMKVSGVGEHLADALLQARSQSKGFKSWKEVDAVSGIGASRLKQLQEYFTLPE